MSRRRLTREETREQTTHRLMDAAEKEIARKGLDATSVEDIALAAGYTRGAFYSNFSSKEDLFVALLRRDHQSKRAQFEALMSDALSAEQLEAQLVEIYSHLYRDNECFLNWEEARLLAVRDARFRAKLDALMAEKRAEVATIVEYIYGRLGATPPLPPETIAFGFMSLVEGVRLAILSSSTDQTAAAESVLALFLRSLLASARAQAQARR